MPSISNDIEGIVTSGCLLTYFKRAHASVLAKDIYGWPIDKKRITLIGDLSI